MQKITPFLWFDDKAEEAANYYVSVFRNSKIRSVARHGEAGAEVSGRPEGTFGVESSEIVLLLFCLATSLSPFLSRETYAATRYAWA